MENKTTQNSPPSIERIDTPEATGAIIKKTSRIRKVFYFLILLFCLLCFAVYQAYISLPYILEKQIFPWVGPKVGFHNLMVKVNTANLDELDLSSFSVSDKNKKGLSIGNLKLLVSGNSFKSLDIDNASIVLKLKDGRVFIPGITMTKDKIAQKQSSVNTTSTRPFVIPAFIAPGFLLAVRNAGITLLVSEGKSFRKFFIPLNVKFSRKGNIVQYLITSKMLDLKFAKYDIKIPEVEIKGKLLPQGDNIIVTGSAKFTNGSYSDAKLAISGINGVIPFNFKLTGTGMIFEKPYGKQLKPGNINIDRIIFKGKACGSIKLVLSQRKAGYKINGRFYIASDENGKGRVPLFLPGFEGREITIDGIVIPPSMSQPLRLNLNAGVNWKKLDLNFQNLYPSETKTTFRGDISASVNCGIRNGRFKTSGKVSIKQGKVNNDEQDFTVDGVTISLDLNDLLNLKSKPSQVLSFGKLKAGNFLLDSGKITFQAESPSSILIEKTNFKWCNGYVAANSFRVHTDRPDDIDLILYCDRLNVAEVLNQFTTGNASGDGNVSGRIPVRIKKGIIRIDDGFLYSTPGVKGRLSLTDFMGSAASLANTVQLAITTEALKHFIYDWVKISLNSEDSEMLIQLELSGKPADKLPFTFDKDKGGLCKSDSPDKMAEFQGITFHLNFRIPSDKLLEFGKKFNEMKNKFSQ